MKLRDYQSRAVSEAIESLRSGHRTVIVAPTGSGKTVMGDAVTRSFAGRVVWLAHRRELLDQAKRQLETNLGEPVGIVSGSRRASVDARIVVASVQSAPELRGSELIIIDEAHRSNAGTYRALLAQADGAVLGLTATPWRLDGEGLDDVFDRMIVAAQPSELIASGHAVAPRVFGVPASRASEIVKGVRVGVDGDFRGSDAAKTMIAADIVAEWRRHANGQRTLVFAVNRAHGKDIAGRFVADGVAAEFVDGTTPQAIRDSIFARLTSGETTVVVGVDVFTEGFDIPAVRCVSLARPTRSLTQYLQACGRAARKFGDSTPTIIDHAGNTYRHGMPMQDREWSLEARPRDGGNASAPLRCCPVCEAIIPLSSGSCPECSVELKVTAREVEEVTTIRLVEMSRQPKSRRVMVECVACHSTFATHPSWAGKHQARCERCRVKRPRAVGKVTLQCKKCGDDFEVSPRTKAAGVVRCEGCRYKRAPRGSQTRSEITSKSFRARRARLIADGTCPDCGIRPGEGGLQRCSPCSEKQRARLARRRAA